MNKIIGTHVQKKKLLATVESSCSESCALGSGKLTIDAGRVHVYSQYLAVDN